MEVSSASQRTVTMDDGKFCKCDEGWTCNITQTEASKAGTPFSKCGSSCICITDAATGNQFSDLQKALESSATGKVFCKCDQGWTCVISKADGSQAGKTFFECGEGCICVIDETNKLQVTCA
ncbi:hypothetical protein POM88_014248 [Heracleum sosnowskyi]|uniref:Uncharacterized protein n=1 Tax=Heracleum sosnowskyi TaxID=360622 RepID=A0AAD8N407_9APIA|nr:hypothetical protein POM88_014248 [Heracleum sosnowskyi]